MTIPTGLVILAVDDDANMRLGWASALPQRIPGCRIITSSSGEGALAVAVSERLDCVLLDIRMEGLSGIQTLRLLRGDPATAGLAIIVITAFTEEKLTWALDAGADAVLRKPTPVPEIVRVMLDVMALTPEQRAERLQERASRAPSQEDDV